MKKIIWTIENGYIDDNGEEICTNENYIIIREFQWLISFMLHVVAVFLVIPVL